MIILAQLTLNYLKKNLKVVNPNLKKDRAKEKTKPTDVILSIKGNLINITMDYFKKTICINILF